MSKLDSINKGSVVGSVIFASCIENISKVILEQRQSEPCFVCIANVHMVVTARQNKLLKSAMEAAAIVTSDGMPLVWELRRKGFKDADRVSGPDLMIALCQRANDERIPIYFYGGLPSIVETMKVKLTEHFPDLIIAGIESPPMLSDQPEIDQVVVERIKASGAEIVFVGLGCPKQELWMHAYSPHIPAVLIGVGAAFDFFTGSIKRAPLWMQHMGLEWFYRLCSEPRRLWKRYLLTNSLFIWFWLRDRLSEGK
ncbi:MAG: WecB/TagA/CpsF family glycosyltransferase [Mariprofundaceae bacterium]|nr:WecB/TagA/CpsF family glycosyltransferase [Mariprofundaceae bacterium]